MTNEPRIALRLPNGQVHDLTADQARHVIADHPKVARDYRKWTAMTQSRGRLILIDEQLVAQIVAEHSIDSDDEPPDAFSASSTS